jgi:hypothetical protein
LLALVAASAHAQRPSIKSFLVDGIGDDKSDHWVSLVAVNIRLQTDAVEATEAGAALVWPVDDKQGKQVGEKRPVLDNVARFVK